MGEQQGFPFARQPSDPLDIQDYLDATSDAAKRTRTVMVILITICLLIFAGLLNSLQNSWMRERLLAMRNPDGTYVSGKIGPPPVSDANSDGHFSELGCGTIEEARKLRMEQYLRFYSEACQAYVETSFAIRVPFFGFSVDVNDLGLLGGVALVLILIVCRLCLAREVENIRIAFREARSLKKLPDMYHLLVMRQVFTIPPAGRPRSWYIRFVPRILYVVPPLVHGAVVVHDFLTAYIGECISKPHALLVLGADSLLFGVIALLSVRAAGRQATLDNEWEIAWAEFQPDRKPS